MDETSDFVSRVGCGISWVPVFLEPVNEVVKGMDDIVIILNVFCLESYLEAKNTKSEIRLLI